MHQSRPEYRKFYFMQDQRYTSQDQCVLAPTLCRASDKLAETSVSLVLLSVLLLIYHPRGLCRQFYIFQYYRYTSQDQCVVSTSEMWEFFIFHTFHVLFHHMEAHSCLLQGLEIYLIQKIYRLATKRFHQITKKLDFCVYFNFASPFFTSIIAKMIIKSNYGVN